MFVPRQIERLPDGRYRLRLSDGERALFHSLHQELAELLADPDDPGLRRLFPPAHDDAERDEQYQALVRDQLVSGRAQALDIVRAAIEGEVLTAEEADAWLRVLNDLRLVLGTRLDVTEDTDFEQVDPEDPRGRELIVYAYLSWLQEELVAALSEEAT